MASGGGGVGAADSLLTRLLLLLTTFLPMASGGGGGDGGRGPPPTIFNSYRRTKMLAHRAPRGQSLGRHNINMEEEDSDTSTPSQRPDAPTQPVEETPPPPSQATSRLYIQPEGHHFNPSRQPIHKIRDIIRSRFDAPYLSWGDIPLNVREMWFREFQKDFYWNAEHNHAIWDNFNKRGGNRMRDMFTDIRKSMQRPLWIGEDVWEALKAAWSTPDYIAKRSQAKKNRAADTDGLGSSLHTCGSIPMTEHRRRMVKELGREPETIELYKWTHTKADQTYVDLRAKHISDNFPIEDEDHMSPSAAEGLSSEMPSAQSGFEKWKKAVGGKKKGRIYGLGSQGVAYEQASTSRYSSSGPDILNDKLEAMQVQMEASIKNEMEERMAQMRAQFESMTERLLKQIKKSSKKKGKKKVRKEVHEKGKGKKTSDESSSD